MMNDMEFRLKDEFIELDNMLKSMGLVPNGVEAKRQILARSVKVNAQIETRIRRKLRAGDIVEFGADRIVIV